MRPASDLLKKYNVPGPRYTSYPTVPYWERQPTETEWLESIGAALQETERAARGAAVYIHIPFCKALCTYCGCNTRIVKTRTTVEPYVQSLLKEWSLYLDGLHRERAVPLLGIHLGGGTPTFLTPDELKRLLEGILARSQPVPGHEFSVEADPRVTSREHLSTLAALGFTRLSLGIQDFDPRVQKAIHREQSEEVVRQTTQTARELGYSSVSYDLVYGLPFQTLGSIEMTAAAVMRLRPDRIACYSYAHVPWIKPVQRLFTESDLPSADGKRALYELVRRELEDGGYREIGMDHFALPGDPLWKAETDGTLHRSFMGYTSRQETPLIGLGVSSIGDSWGAFAQNEKVLENYSKRVAEGRLPVCRGHVLDEEDKVLRRHILNLMTRFETRWSEPAQYVPYLDCVAGRLEELCRDGLVEFTPKSCKVLDKGRAFVRNICMAFDARLVRKAPTTALFSQTI